MSSVFLLIASVAWWGLASLLALAAGLWVVVGTGLLVRAIMWPRRKTLAVALGRGDPGEPSELGLAGEAVVFSLSRGVESPGWVIEGKRAEGPAVVIAHGHRNSRYGSLWRAGRFVEFASKVVVFDLPAHGEASGGRCTLGAQEHEDVLRVVERLGADRVVLFGSSMGARIALRAAGRCERCVGVICEAPFRWWHVAARNRMRAQRYPLFFVPLAGAVMRVMGAGVGFDSAADAAKLRCPLLLLHARRDPVCPLSGTRAIAAAAPQSEVVLFEAEGHGDLARADEARYRGALVAFFDRLDNQLQSTFPAEHAPEHTA